MLAERFHRKICILLQKLATSEQIGWWECERVRIAFEIAAYCPDILCKIGVKDAGKDQKAASFVSIGRLISSFISTYR